MKGIIDSIGRAIDKTGEAFDKNFTSKEEVLEKVNEIKIKLIEAHQAIRLEEARGNWMQRSWRPLSGLAFVLIITYNKLIAVMFGLPTEALEPEFWNLFQIILGVFGLTRGIEKSVKAAGGFINRKRKNERETD